MTFDTSTLDGVVYPSNETNKAGPTYRVIHNAVKTGQIRGFFGEAVVTLDAIARTAKAKVLGATRIVSETSSTGPKQVTIMAGPRWKRFDIGPQILMRLEAARGLGMRALIGPRRIGDSPVAQGFGEDFYEPYPTGAGFQVAVDTTNSLDAAIVARGLGRALIIKFAQSVHS